MDRDKLLKQTSTSYRVSRKNADELIERRGFHLRLYTGYNHAGSVENSDGLVTHVPYTKTLFDNVYPLLTANLPISKCSPRDSDKSFMAAKLMDNLINYTFDVNNFEQKYMMIKKESMMAGDSFIMVIWNPEVADDPKKNYPLLMHLNVDDVTPHANKLDIDDEWPLYIRREMTKRQMKEMGWNKAEINKLGESKLGNKSYRRNQLKKIGLSPATDKDGNPIKDKNGNPIDDLYEVCIQWGMMEFGEERKMGMVVVGNPSSDDGARIINTDPVRKDLEPFESPYANNVMPVAHMKYDPLPNSFWSQSFIDPIEKDQVELNDLESMKRVNYYRRNNPPLIVNKDAEPDLSTLKFLAGMPWVIKGGSASVEPYVLPDLSALIVEDQKMIMQRMQNVTGASDFLNPSPEVIQKSSGKSATHAAIMNENTKMRYRPQSVFEDKCMEKIGKLLINIWQDKNFFNEEIAVSMTDEEGYSVIQEIEHSMIQGEIDFVVTSASSIAQSDQAKLATSMQILELFAQDQTMDMAPVKRQILELSQLDPYKIMKPKAGMLPELQRRLQQWTYIQNQKSFASLSMAQRMQVLDFIQLLSGQIKELTQKAQQQQKTEEQSQIGAQKEAQANQAVSQGGQQPSQQAMAQPQGSVPMQQGAGQ